MESLRETADERRHLSPSSITPRPGRRPAAPPVPLSAVSPYPSRGDPLYLPYVEGGLSSKMLAAPFARTLRLAAAGPNVAVFSVPGHGHVYWGTSLSPGAAAVREFDARLVRDERVLTALAAICGSFWHPRRPRLFVMRGNRLPPNTSRVMMPRDVFDMLRAGFFDFQPAAVTQFSFRLTRRVLRLHRFLAEDRGTALGLKRGPGKSFLFSMKSITSMLTCTPELLAGVMCDSFQTAQCFSGRVSYKCGLPDGYPHIEGPGLIHISDGMPVGRWMSGRYRDTGYGLLCRSENMYYRVESIGNTSKFIRCGPGDIDFETWEPRAIMVGRVIE